MSRRSRPSIPQELHQLKAQEIYEQRIAKGKNGSPEEDWETARRYLTRYPKVVRAWKRNKLSRILTNADTRTFALDVVKTIATFTAVIGFLITYWNALLDRRIAQERLITDRFAKAVEQIGSGEEEVVIGGIYSLERITKDSPKDQWTIMEVLTALVRENSSIPPEIQQIPTLGEPFEEKLKALEKLNPVDIPIKAALTVIGRRDRDRDYTSDEDPEQNTKKLDLSNSNLNSAYLHSADLHSANLINATLRRVNLDSTDLRSANLINADLFFANLGKADLRNAILDSANLSSASLFSADLHSAILKDANLRNVILMDAQNLSNKQIKLACLWEEAIYTDAKWNITEKKWMTADEKANQKRIEEIKRDKASDPKNPPDCSKWK